MFKLTATVNRASICVLYLITSPPSLTWIVSRSPRIDQLYLPAIQNSNEARAPLRLIACLGSERLPSDVSILNGLRSSEPVGRLQIAQPFRIMGFKVRIQTTAKIGPVYGKEDYLGSILRLDRKCPTCRDLQRIEPGAEGSPAFRLLDSECRLNGCGPHGMS